MTKNKKRLVIAAAAALLAINGLGITWATATTIAYAGTPAHSPEQTAQDSESSRLDEATQTPAHESWSMTFTCEHAGVAGEGGYVCTQDGIPAGRECVIRVSPAQSYVVRDDSVMCPSEGNVSEFGCSDMSFNPCADLDTSRVEWSYARGGSDNRIPDDGRLTSDDCDPDTTCEGLDVDSDY